MEQNKTNKQTTNWVFIPLVKKHIIKRTDKYVLFKINNSGSSAIVSASFIRKKETDKFIYLSLPETYEVNCRTTEFKNGKWVVTNEISYKPQFFRTLVLDFNEEDDDNEPEETDAPF